MADTKISEMSGTKVAIGLVVTIILSLIVFTAAKAAWEKKLAAAA